MYSFFSTKMREMRHVPILDFVLMGVGSFFVGRRLLQMQWEKEELQKANPGMKVTVKPYPGKFGTVWSWALEEKKVESPTPSDKPAAPLQPRK